MKKVISIVLVCALTILLFAVPVSAATVNTNQLFIPQVSSADGTFGPGGADFVGGDFARPYWVGENITGAFTFGNWWRTNTDRTMPTTQVSKVTVVFKIPIGASEGDTLAFNSTLTLQYYSGASLEVYLMAYNEEGYFGNRYQVFDGVASRITDLSFTTFIDQLHYTALSHSPADFFYLFVTVSGLENGSGANLKNGIWFQFSKDSTFSAGSGANAPIYEGADTSTTDEFTGAEEQLMEDTAQGREDAESIMSVDSFMDNLNKLMPGILAATQIMDLCFDTIAPLQTLTYIALALGFVSFVLGTVNMVVGSVRSANARKEREAQREKRRSQR